MAVPIITKKRVNYLSNKNILAEIHKSKNTYCYFIDPIYKNYDCIVASIEDITPEKIYETKVAKARRLTLDTRAKMKEEGLSKKERDEFLSCASDFNTEDLVFRVMTYEHIPLEEGRIKNPREESDYYTKLKFPPFKHYIIRDGEFLEVGRSHWKDALDNGVFCQDHGRMTNTLGRMFLKLVDRYAQKANWRDYSYIEDMKSQAIAQLSDVGLQFNEFRSENPFAYYTSIVTISFTKIFNIEKKNQHIRDELLMMNGAAPSITRQIESSLSQQMPDSLITKRQPILKKHQKK